MLVLSVIGFSLVSW